MIISDRHRFVFVHNPKCGGTVFRDAVRFTHDYPTTFWHVRASPPAGRLLDYAHLRLWEVRDLFPDVYARIQNCTSFVFVRDPMRRFLSALHHHFRAYRRTTLIVDRLSSGEKLSLFQGFVRNELCTERILEDPQYVHFSLQKWFCALDGERVVKHVLPFEDRPLEAASTLLQLPLPTDRWRAGNSAEANLFSDPVLIAFAERFYAEDYEFFSALPSSRAAPDDAPACVAGAA